MEGGSTLLGRPDPAIVRWDREPRLLECHNAMQVKLAAMEILDVITADREPERHGLIRVTGIYSDQRILAA